MIADTWEQLGGEVTGSPVLYDPDASTYDSEAAQIVAGDPDAFVIFDFPETYAKMGAALVRTGKFDAKKLYTTSGFPAAIPEGTPATALEGGYVVNPGQPESGEVIDAYNKLYANSSIEPTKQQPFNTNVFDASMLCTLAAVASGSSDGAEIAKQVSAVSSPPGKEFTFLQLSEAFTALRAGEDIDYQGVSGPLDLNENGDPSAGLSNVSQYRMGKLELLRQIRLVGDEVRTVSPNP